MEAAPAAADSDEESGTSSSEEAPSPPRIDHSVYEVVIWCGVSFRRFTRLWTPERTHFFPAAFQARALAVLCAAQRLRPAPLALALGVLHRVEVLGRVV